MSTGPAGRPAGGRGSQADRDPGEPHPRAGVALYAAAPEMAGRGVVYASAAGDVALLCVYGMPALPSNTNYQFWLIKDGRRRAVGYLPWIRKATVC